MQSRVSIQSLYLFWFRSDDNRLLQVLIKDEYSAYRSRSDTRDERVISQISRLYSIFSAIY